MFGDFIEEWRSVQEHVHATAHSKGWWDQEDGPRNQGEMIALMHSELSEALEGLRAGNPQDHHCEHYKNVEVELADVIIRIMDYAEAYDHDVSGAVIAKMMYNDSRDHKHGGKEF